MFSWIARLIGKDIANKIGLEDIKMTDTTIDTKPWFKSKTIWAAIVTGILGALGPISTAFGHPVVVPQWILDVLIGMGIYTARTSTSTIE